ncbi:hypothetical protein CTAYLR_009350 [Chrysophaeum taylorii]|uniref:AAA+ ATPase domain-containing protein n=1 Tax=Chrysophaeum taylorii TaxID=2483200 RepID=A0AAD7XN98_9STRA|nr:hypothetical protein CTAYLR_009350 [Chrysophaeum taylorii]
MSDKKLRFLVKKLVSAGEVSTSDSAAVVITALARQHAEYARKPQAALRREVQEALGALRPETTIPPPPAANKVLLSPKAGKRPVVEAEDEDDFFVRRARRRRPSERLCDVAGADEAARVAIESVIEPMRHAGLYEALKISGPRGVLVHGPPGCGKTLVGRAIAGEACDEGITFVEVSGADLASRRDVDRDMRRVFEAARDAAPCVLFLDDLDAVLGKEAKRVSATLCSCLDGLDGSRVAVVGAATAVEVVDPRLRRFGRLEREIALSAPNARGREAVLRHLIARLGRVADDVVASRFARVTPGWVGADLAALVSEAGACAVRRHVAGAATLEVTGADLEAARERVAPSFCRAGFAASPNVSWTDVGALADVRDELACAILAPIADPDKFSALGVPLPAGVLLYGPPGCGKTLLAKALATESCANFVAIKGPELLDKYVGESERAVRGVFSRARASAPCIVFFDEIDALCPRRSETNDSNSAVTDRVVNQLLTELDGLDARGQVYVVAATNRPELLDPALLRPGRVDKLLLVPLPSKRDRTDILRALTSRVRLDDDVDLDSLATDPRADGFSGADLAALVREAGLAALNDGAQTCVKARHFREALDRVPPSVLPSDARAYDTLGLRLSKKRPRE